ncbi:hypothetical protein NQZ79_g2762 [Umbelopsis isabellina]|nr:hypothetical protein NQZ79_g2762 [Umbelopsis isabellina]
MASLQQTGLTPNAQSVAAAHSTHDILNESIAKRVDPIYSKTLQSRVQELLKIHHDGFPGSQPVSFEAKHLIDLQREDYFVCEKSDGVRYLMFATHTPKGPATFLLDRNRSWFFIPHLLFPLRGKDTEYHNETLMDGELVMDIDENKMLQQEVIQPFHAAKISAPFKVELKKMERSYGLGVVFDQMTRLKHASDGVIFTPVKLPYTPGTCEKLLKWKPAELNTVDFRIAVKWSKEHKPIYSLEVVMQGKNFKFYDHLQLEQETALEWKKSVPDGRIGEFRYDPQWNVTIVEPGYAPTVRKGGWRFVKFREDKELANDEQVVKKILKSIQDGITKEQLLAHMEDIRAAWKAREKGIPMPDPVSKIGHSININTEDISKSITANPFTATPAIISPSSNSNPFDTYNEKRQSHGHRDSMSSAEYMPDSRKNSLVDNSKEQKSDSDDANDRKQSMVEPMPDSDHSNLSDEKSQEPKNVESPQWKGQSVFDTRRKFSEEKLEKLNTIRKHSDDSSIKSATVETPKLESPVKSESSNLSEAVTANVDTPMETDNPVVAEKPPDMTLRQMIESKMPPKFRGGQGKKRSDSIKSVIETSPSIGAASQLSPTAESRDVKRSKSDSPSGVVFPAQHPNKLSLSSQPTEGNATAQQSTVPHPNSISPPPSFNGRHRLAGDSEFGEYRRRKVSSPHNTVAVKMDRTSSPPLHETSKASKNRKIQEQSDYKHSYSTYQPNDTSSAPRYDTMNEAAPMQMSSATIRHQQLLEQRASPYTMASSKSAFATPVSPYQHPATRNIYSPSENHSNQRRHSDDRSFASHEQRVPASQWHSSPSAPPSRRPSHDEPAHSTPSQSSRAQPSSIADLLTTTVEVTPPSSRQATESPVHPHRDRPSSGSSERANPFDFAKILHSPTQRQSDEEIINRSPNGRRPPGEMFERSSDEGAYHQYSSNPRNAVHFINYRTDINQPRPSQMAMENQVRQEPVSSGSKTYVTHSHMPGRSNSTHASPRSATSSPDFRGYQPTHIVSHSPTYSSSSFSPTTSYQSPQMANVNRGPPENMGGVRYNNSRQPVPREHPMAAPYRQSSYPQPYGYHSPVMQHSISIPPNDDANNQYRRQPYQEAVQKPMVNAYQDPQYSSSQRSPRGGAMESHPPPEDVEGKNHSGNSRTKSKLDFILNYD